MESEREHPELINALNIDPWNPRFLPDGTIELTPDKSTQDFFKKFGEGIIGAQVTIASASELSNFSRAEIVAVNTDNIVVRPMD